MTITAVYVHPQGKRVEVHDNGALVCTKNGKAATTSATAAKLAAGYGGWTLVQGDVDAAAAAVALPAHKAAPSAILAPMRFAEAPVADLGSYVNDPAWALQQKLDGVRAQLVFEPGRAPWFRNSKGERLANTAVAPVANKILAVLAPHTSTSRGYAVDGEILQGAFYVFDLVVDGETATLSDRLLALEAWHLHVSGALQVPVHLVTTCTSVEAKARLGFAVLNGGGEGWIAKRLDSTYDWGQRVDHSVKLKVTSTVDCVVMRKDPAKDAVVLGAHDADGALVEIGRASTIGKGAVTEPGTVVEVKYLYASADARLTQPTILRVRTDKAAADCSTAQLRFVNKAVIEL